MSLNILDQRALALRLESLKKQGQTIVFTNGCFDLLHVGHTRYLKAAKALGDILVVALNSDASVTRLKGLKRPFVVEEERAELIASLIFVDFVVVFEEDTPLDLIKKLKPHILTKGGDYKGRGIVGEEVLLSYGGRVVVLPEEKGKSTTSLCDRIQNLRLS